MDKPSANAQNVVCMSDYQPDHGFAAIAQVEAYWEALRGGRLIPKRSEIDPRGIEQILEYAFIIERIAPGIARLRIAGSHLTDMMGMEVRGMPLTAFFAPAARRRVSGLLEEMFQTPAIVDLRMTSQTIAATAIPARMILLPLKSDLGDVSRCLGCFVALGELSPTPLRFDIDHQALRLIRPGTSPVEIKTPALRPPAATAPTEAAKPMLAGFAAPEAAFKARTSAKDRVVRPTPPYLRLIKSDDHEK